MQNSAEICRILGKSKDGNAGDNGNAGNAGWCGSRFRLALKVFGVANFKVFHGVHRLPRSMIDFAS